MARCMRMHANGVVSGGESSGERGGKAKATGTNRRVRLGVVSETQGNHSPGLLLQGLLTRLSKADFDLVFFEVPNLTTSFAVAMRAAAAESPVLESAVPGLNGALDSARSQIEAAEVDVLLYMALGMTPLTFLLAQTRLARVQVRWWCQPSSSPTAASRPLPPPDSCLPTAPPHPNPPHPPHLVRVRPRPPNHLGLS